MAIAKVDIELRAGYPWRIDFTAHEADGTTVLPLPSGTIVEFILISLDGLVVMQRSTEDASITIVDENLGEARIEITTQDQIDAVIGPGKAYFYEIRVGTVDEWYPQAEGMLRVRASIFGDTVDPLLLQFRARFPEFTDSDDIIAMSLDEAHGIVVGLNCFASTDVDLATLYLAAHFAEMKTTAASQHGSGGLETGPVLSIRIEDRSVTYGNPNQSTGGATTTKVGLAQTIYGQHYLALLRRTVRWIERA